VLIRVRAASVNPLDWHFMRGEPRLMRIMTGIGKPKTGRLGVDVAGTVEGTGAEVFGAARGAFAEFACAKESDIAAKPDGVSFEEAAATPVAASTALQALRDKARLRAGQKVLINGAAGGVGTFAVQIAKSFGANVIGVCSTRNVEMVRSIGCDRVIDYTREDFVAGGERYDVVLDCVGNHSLRAFIRVLERNGVYVQIGGPPGKWIAPMGRIVQMLLLSPFVKPKLSLFVAKVTRDDLAAIGSLLASGKARSVIDRTYALNELPQAIAYVEEGHARGKVVITV
jgi:NADPH:quinone reductase-like Zn-dependent oxidoreductase